MKVKCSRDGSPSSTYASDSCFIHDFQKPKIRHKKLVDTKDTSKYHCAWRPRHISKEGISRLQRKHLKFNATINLFLLAGFVIHQGAEEYLRY